MNSYLALSIIRTAAKRNRRRSRVANGTDVEFTVAKPQAAIAHKAGDDE